MSATLRSIFARTVFARTLFAAVALAALHASACRLPCPDPQWPQLPPTPPLQRDREVPPPPARSHGDDAHACPSRSDSTPP